MMLPRRIAVTAFVLVAAFIFAECGTAAEPLALSWPVRCTVGEDCWIIQFPDVDPAKGTAKDHACGNATYDEHKGTDIAIEGITAMRKGVAVIAAAAGTVVGTRNDQRDAFFKPDQRASLKNVECGNGVRIGHGDGWFTQYCHMRQGSVAVAKGSVVKSGDYLGLVGLSGVAEVPHLHLQVERQGNVIDPFLGAPAAKGCGPGKPLWRNVPDDVLRYRPTTLFHVGFAAAEPKFEAIRDGLHDDAILSVHSPALVFWGEGFWIRPRDRIAIRIRGPQQEIVLEHERVIESAVPNPAHFFAGRQAKGKNWPAGIYTGEITLTRSVGEGKPPDDYTARRTVTLR